MSVKHEWLRYLCSVLGWIYFLAWSVSFYPQVFLNRRRQTTLGCSWDFLAMNWVGFLFYSLFNASVFIRYSHSSHHENPVELNDLIFAVHAFLVTCVTLGQVFYYDRPFQGTITMLNRLLCGCLCCSIEAWSYREPSEPTIVPIPNTLLPSQHRSNNSAAEVRQSLLTKESTRSMRDRLLAETHHARESTTFQGCDSDEQLIVPLNTASEEELSGVISKLQPESPNKRSSVLESKGFTAQERVALDWKSAAQVTRPNLIEQTIPENDIIEGQISIFAAVFLTTVLTIAVYNTFLALFTDDLLWVSVDTSRYTCVQFLGFIKVAVSAIKYVPQAYMNYRDKSTTGWSIINICLDFTGGSLSLLQQVLISYNTGDSSVLFGNVPKLLLALLSVFFDIIFLVQHFILYGYNDNRSMYVSRGTLQRQLMDVSDPDRKSVLLGDPAKTRKSVSPAVNITLNGAADSSVAVPNSEQVRTNDALLKPPSAEEFGANKGSNERRRRRKKSGRRNNPAAVAAALIDDMEPVPSSDASQHTEQAPVTIEKRLLQAKQATLGSGSTIRIDGPPSAKQSADLQVAPSLESGLLFTDDKVTPDGSSLFESDSVSRIIVSVPPSDDEEVSVSAGPKRPSFDI